MSEPYQRKFRDTPAPPPPPPKPRRTRRRRHPLLRWLGRVTATLLAIYLAILLFPWASRNLFAIWMDGGRARVVSKTLSRELASSSRLETLTIDEQGVISSTLSVFFGDVQQVTIYYDYHASLGIDLSEVTVAAEGNEVVLYLPPLVLLSDSLTPTETVKWDVLRALSEKRRQKLMDDERQSRRAAALETAASEEGWQRTCEVLRNLCTEWVSGLDAGVSFRFMPKEGGEGPQLAAP